VRTAVMEYDLGTAFDVGTDPHHPDKAGLRSLKCGEGLNATCRMCDE